MKQLKQILREIFIVIIGILIALVINNWNEDRKDKKYLNHMFSSIKTELKESNLDIKRIMPKQKSLIDSIDVYSSDESVSILDLLLIGNGIQKPHIKLNSWKAIANSKIELINYEQLTVLSDIEESKETLNLRIEKTTDFIFANLQETDKGKKELLKLMTLDAIYAEERLHSVIAEFIEK